MAFERPAGVLIWGIHPALRLVVSQADSSLRDATKRPK